MTKPRFTIVTASASHARTKECIDSWFACSGMPFAIVTVAQGKQNWTIEDGKDDDCPAVLCQVPTYLGPVPAFKLGVDLALQITAPDGIIACLHDDLLIEESNWDAKIMAFFNTHSECGLLGFGGGTGLGSDDIYQSPYSPYQLARQDFVSNMRDAEVHGRRSTEPVRVACLDGFSQIGRVEYWQGCKWVDHEPDGPFLSGGYQKPLDLLEMNGVIHHCYDSYLGGLANARGWQVWMLPIKVHHFGGATAVGDSGYAEWAKTKYPDGDAGFWEFAHKQCYDLLRGVLPIRIPQD